MPITTAPPAAVDAPPANPSRSDTPANFITKANSFIAWFAPLRTFLAAFVTWWATFKAEVEATVSELNAMQGVAMRYKFGNATADADPGAGFLLLGNATQNLSTVVRMDLTDLNGSNVQAILDAMDDSTSPHKGYLRLVNAIDPTRWILFNITGAVAAPTGYRNVTVTVQASSSANPFVNGDTLIASFVRTGDQGSAWTGGAIANRAYTSSVAVTRAATTVIDAALSNVFRVTLDGNITTLTINNPADGQTINVRFAQDATGGRTVALAGSGASWVAAQGGLDTGANKVSWLAITYVAAAARWEGAWMTVG